MAVKFWIAALLLIIPATCFGKIDTLQLQGKGEARYLGIIKVYDAALYTPHPVRAGDILGPDISRCLRLDYAVALKIDDFILGANSVLSRQHDGQRLKMLEAEIDRLHGAYRDVEKGDRYTLCYAAEKKETTLSLNRQQLVSIVSADFAAVYFGIWLGPQAPLDETLRDKLLASPEKN